MKKYIFIFALFIAGCTQTERETIPLFNIGDTVCHKSGGPKGVIFYNDSNHYVKVRFYIGKNTAPMIGVGGSGLIVGGNGIKMSNSIFEEVWFKEYELKSCE